MTMREREGGKYDRHTDIPTDRKTDMRVHRAVSNNGAFSLLTTGQKAGRSLMRGSIIKGWRTLKIQLIIVQLHNTFTCLLK